MPAIRPEPVLDALYAAAADPAGWPAALAALADHVGAGSAMLVRNAPAGRHSTLLAVRTREDLDDLYLRRHVWNPWTRGAGRVPPSRVVAASAVADWDMVRRTEFHADILHPQGIRDMLFVTHAGFAAEGAVGGISVSLDARQADRVGAASRCLQRLAPHLSRALDLSRRFAARDRGSRQLAALLDLLPGAALLLDPRGRVSHANPAAAALLRQGDGLTVTREGGLRPAAALPAENAALTRRIARALAVAAGDPVEPGGPLCLTRPGRGPPPRRAGGARPR
ncbi:PAS domain-containing protein, partial [Roseomonas sp. NAR14]